MKPGDKVLCIKRGLWLYEGREQGTTWPRFGMELTIRTISNTGGLKFEEIINPIKQYKGGLAEKSFASYRFRKLEHYELKTCETELTEA